MTNKNIHLNLKVGSELNSIFEKPEKRMTKIEQVEKINIELSSLDRKILILQNDFNNLLFKKTNLLVLIDNEKNKWN